MTDFDVLASFIPSLHKPSSLLPIARHRQSLLYLVESVPITIVVGQTGPHIPKSMFCFESVLFLLDSILQLLDLEQQY